jgi:hypothetical protein
VKPWLNSGASLRKCPGTASESLVRRSAGTCQKLAAVPIGIKPPRTTPNKDCGESEPSCTSITVPSGNQTWRSLDTPLICGALVRQGFRLQPGLWSGHHQ